MAYAEFYLEVVELQDARKEQFTINSHGRMSKRQAREQIDTKQLESSLVYGVATFLSTRPNLKTENTMSYFIQSSWSTLFVKHC